jgi:hypothetical protein
MNVPFDNLQGYERCYLALIAGIVGLGLFPHSVLEIPAGAADRQQRIFQLMLSCRYSVHDLSRIQLSAGVYPRFNMPFEAGLASALVLIGRKHHRFILEARAYRIQRTLSDLNGVDVYVHQGTAVGVLRELCNMFVRPGSAGLPRLVQIFRILTRFADEELRRTAGPAGLYEPRLFARLVVQARRIERVLPG